MKLLVGKINFLVWRLRNSVGDFSYSMGDFTMVITARVRLTRTCFDFGSDSLGNDFLYEGFL